MRLILSVIRNDIFITVDDAERISKLEKCRLWTVALNVRSITLLIFTAYQGLAAADINRPTSVLKEYRHVETHHG